MNCSELTADNFVSFFGSSQKTLLILHCKLGGGSQMKEILMRNFSFSIFILSSYLAQASNMENHYHVLLLTGSSGDFCPLINKMLVVWFETHLFSIWKCSYQIFCKISWFSFYFGKCQNIIHFKGSCPIGTF